jgi:prepilin-type N-terminal cleavage/methylation domain-containing protein
VPRRLVGRLAAESGFTLLELLMAILLASVALGALVSVLETSRRLVTVAEKQETAVHQAERELERILALPYAEVALTAAPAATSGDPDDPRRFVVSGRYRWDQDATPRTDDLVINGVAGTAGGTLDPMQPWTDGQSRLSGHIHRFVTRAAVPCGTGCTDPQAARRITVVVTVDAPGGGGPERSVLIDSIKIDPTRTGVTP